MNPKKTLYTMFVDDDMVERMKFERTVNTLDFPVRIIEAINGEDALAKLKTSDELPHIIILDLNMPRINGIEFLKILKSDEKLKFLPTIILTTSNNQKDLLSCYEIGIAGYMLKPLKYEEYEDKIKSTLIYWNNIELITQ